jgi:redox-sensitive bicupin YhaK (pirin superfamily)
MPQQEHGKMHGFQMWVNLPKKDKMVPPRYQDFQASQIPIVKLENGISVKIMAGEFQDTKGAGTFSNFDLIYFSFWDCNGSIVFGYHDASIFKV